MHCGQKILILDCGSQYTPLIARRVRELNVYSEVAPWDIPLEKAQAFGPAGIILSGGPQSVFESGAPSPDPGVLGMGVPVLGICYGMQWMAHELAGKVAASSRREYGAAEFLPDLSCPIFAGLQSKEPIWMSHGDRVEALPRGFVSAGRTESSPHAAMADLERSFYGIQFHPEVSHTLRGKEILRHFLYDVCGAVGDWNSGSFVEEAVAQLRATVGNERVLCAVSGGVDSSVMALLVSRAIGDRAELLFIDHGLLRKDEASQVEELFGRKFHLKLSAIKAGARFFEALRGVTDPEEKRKAVGRAFIEVFEEAARSLGRIPFLAQGTIYPDRIESASASRTAKVIKSHHNVGGLPEKMNMRVVEPLRDLFKDEVRQVGRLLGLDEEFVARQPFPGPGLAVRIVGEVTEADVKLLQEADAIFTGEIREAGLYDAVAQAFAVLLPVRTVGVMGDSRTYERVIALRAVTTSDFMTADWFRFDPAFLARVSSRIVNEVKGVNRVVYDVTSKPPGTIEWE
jgi:GMP synthase (glutamine-hydrolysing)